MGGMVRRTPSLFGELAQRASASHVTWGCVRDAVCSWQHVTQLAVPTEWTKCIQHRTLMPRHHLDGQMS